MEFSVWSPVAKSLEVELDGRRFPLQKGEGDWWSTEIDHAAPGMDYAFRIDGGEPLPDPRSPWQPRGVHGPSRVLDHRAFLWTDQHWQARPLKSAIVYELHVGTFTPEGTFEAVIDKLDHLVELGVTHIELMPVNAAPGSYGWGYDGVSLFAPHHEWGGPEGLKRLVNACHGRGLAVVLDVVYNHLGPRGNYLSRFGPYFTERHETPWGWAVNLDQPASDEVRRYFCDNAVVWLRDYHFDGLRLDAVHALIDNSPLHLLEQMAVEVEQLSARLGRHLVLIAESDANDPRLVRSREVGGYGIDAQWSDDFHHALHTVLTGQRKGYYADFGSMQQLAKSLTHAYVYDGCYSACRLRTHGRPTDALAGYHFLGYIQTHDQVGNQAEGKRIGQLVSPGRAKIAAALVMTSPFVPMLFQGEEWNASSPFQYFTNFEDAELGALIHEGRRRELAAFGWDPAHVADPEARETFDESKLKWDEVDRPPHADMLSWYRQLIWLRRRSAVLTNGQRKQVRPSYDEQQGWFVVRRGELTVACNLSQRSQRLGGLVVPAAEIWLASEQGCQLAGGDVVLPGESVAILGPPRKPCELPETEGARRTSERVKAARRPTPSA